MSLKNQREFRTYEAYSDDTLNMLIEEYHRAINEIEKEVKLRNG